MSTTNMILADVVNGAVNAESTPTTKKSDTVGTDALGKEAFLQLLVTQMQYQDPLEPTSDTEFISQLAQFSALEEMQNVSASVDDMSEQLSGIQQQTFAANLVGKNVILYVDEEYIAGKVQYMEVIDGEVKIAVNEKSYSLDCLDTVVDDEYLNSIKDSITNSDTTTEDTTTQDTTTEDTTTEDTEAGSEGSDNA